MASCNIIQSSTSSAPLPKKYDVFVSFRGDTRRGITDHLFGALRRKNISAFRDNRDIDSGESIEPGLLNAIEASQIFIVVFSKNYAYSTWCLQELEHILLHRGHPSEKRLRTVFYDVDPSEVRKQSGSYQTAFDGHVQRFNQDLDKVQRWKLALMEAGKISGCDLRDKQQYQEIEMFVQKIVDSFGYNFSCLPNDLVGMLSPVAELEKRLCLDSTDDVRTVGICGMAGVGKTTLASVLYGKMKASHQFDPCCLIDDVSNTFRNYGLIGVQNQILHQTLGKEHNQIYNHCDATNLIQSRLSRLKALIIFDNVDHSEQLEKLAVNHISLAAGSRIIVVCRDARILKECGVGEPYNVPLLNETNSLQLFCREAFKCDTIMSDYEKLTHEILKYANGLPLAIKMLGSFLLGRDITEWRSALSRLGESPNKNIMDALQFSFYGLEKMELQIFLDIACFFKGCEEKFVKNVLNCCGFHSDIGLRVLVDKSLISISKESKIEMHGLLEDLGRKVVQENSTEDARKWSRLWLHKYCYEVVSENLEKNVEALVLKGKESDTEILMAETLSNMSRLRLLILKDVKCSGRLDNLSNQLRYVAWNRYPFFDMPSSFQPNQLVELILVDSNIRQWRGKKNLSNLRTLDLSFSKKLMKMSDFGEVSNLEQLNLEGCVKLVEMDIGLPKKLVFLNLKNCKSLVSMPNGISDLNALGYLNLYGCSKAFNNPRPLELPSLASFSCLREVDISFCGLSHLPGDIEGLSCVQRLNLGGNDFLTLPSLTLLSKLEYLNLEHCVVLKSLPELHSPAAIKHDEYWSAGMYIFNCCGLDDREHYSNMTFSWMKQFVLANQESSASFCSIDIVVPGNKIPSWFENQKLARSISINTPLMMLELDNNITGIACCVVFSAVPHDRTTRTNGQKPVMHLRFHKDRQERHFCIPVNTNIIMVNSNHLWLTYLTRESFFDILKDIDNVCNCIRMEASIVHVEDFYVEVKSCGYHWLYEQNLQELNLI